VLCTEVAHLDQEKRIGEKGMAMSTVWVLQHVRCETLGIMAQTLDAAGLAARYVRPIEGQPVPKRMEEAAGLIVMGGPMGVYEQRRYPFLRDEMQLIEQALREEKPVLGVCLGSQLLASTLGATVTKGPKKEIGWYPVTLTDGAPSDPLWQDVEPSFMAYHWHGDIFALPQGASSLASSELTACQAFRYGHSAYGFLFHLEMTTAIIAAMVQAFADELHEAGIDGDEMIKQADRYLPRPQRIGSYVFQRWTSLVAGDRR
jgi:GMP synthase (glutamine-hydrolysing)